jgi:hypothetical protein
VKTFRLLLAICALSLGACATLYHRDREFLQQHGVSGPLYEKMLHQEPLTVPEIIELSQHSVPPPFIIHYLQNSYFVYRLNTDDVLHLRKAGVAHEVIDYLLATPTMYSPQGPAGWYPYDPVLYGYPFAPGYYYGPRYYYAPGCWRGRHW